MGRGPVSVMRLVHLLPCAQQSEGDYLHCYTTVTCTAAPRCNHTEKRKRVMAAYKLISADSHIVEPPDMYTSRIEPKFRDRAPRMERRTTPTGRPYDAWGIDGLQVGKIGRASCR